VRPGDGYCDGVTAGVIERAHGSEERILVAAGIVLVPANRLLALLQQRPISENIALPTFGGIRNWGPIGIRAERIRVESAIGHLQIDTRQGQHCDDRAAATSKR
jgi:ABC-type sugar transport system ATPase subunit